MRSLVSLWNWFDCQLVRQGLAVGMSEVKKDPHKSQKQLNFTAALPLSYPAVTRTAAGGLEPPTGCSGVCRLLPLGAGQGREKSPYKSQ
jgi:hypothetical protein